MIDALQAENGEGTIEHEFFLAERSLLMRHRAEVEVQKARAEMVELQQRAMIDALQAENGELRAKHDHHQRRFNDSLTLLQQLKLGLGGRSTLDSVLRAWRAAARCK